MMNLLLNILIHLLRTMTYKKEMLSRLELKIWKILEIHSVSKYYYEDVIVYGDASSYAYSNVPTNLQIARKLKTKKRNVERTISKMYKKNYYTLAYENRPNQERLLVKNITIINHKNEFRWL